MYDATTNLVSHHRIAADLCGAKDILFDIERQNIRDLFLCTSSTQPYNCTMSQHAQL